MLRNRASVSIPLQVAAGPGFSPGTEVTLRGKAVLANENTAGQEVAGGAGWVFIALSAVVGKPEYSFGPVVIDLLRDEEGDDEVVGTGAFALRKNAPPMAHGHGAATAAAAVANTGQQQEEENGPPPTPVPLRQQDGQQVQQKEQTEEEVSAETLALLDAAAERLGTLEARISNQKQQ